VSYNRRSDACLQLTSLYDDLARSGRSPSTRLLVSEMVPAEAVVAEQLAIPTHDSVLHICRLRYADKLPIAKLTNYLPTSTDIDATALEQRGRFQVQPR
jgi:DNA-binding GntR family transcriptional regulator